MIRCHSYDECRSAKNACPKLAVAHPPAAGEAGVSSVKIWRRLQGIGAIAVKNAVHALPMGEGTQEDFEWLLREIVAGGGEAFLCETRLIEGLSDDEVRKMFDEARDADYQHIAKDARALAKALRPKLKAEAVNNLRAQASRLRKRLADVATIDFFGAIGRETAEGLIGELEARLNENEDVAKEPKIGATANALEALRGRTWVTRQGVHVDRIGSAWLIYRFIDPKARFKFRVRQRVSAGRRRVALRHVPGGVYA
jgi:hypothetical protein